MERDTSMKVLMDGDPILRRVSEPVTDFIQAFDLGSRMLSTLVNLPIGINGVALSAPQVGMSLRMFVIHPDVARGEIDRVVINPTWRPLSIKFQVNEGCISFPLLSLKKRRHSKISVTYSTITGEKRVRVVEGLLAQIVQHETEHLDGILLTD